MKWFFLDTLLKRTNCDEAKDYDVPISLSPRGLLQIYFTIYFAHEGLPSS